MRKKKESTEMQCNMCGKDVRIDKNDYYMLKDSVWNDLCSRKHIPYESLLCKGCAEKCLGRKLANADLANVPLNEFLDWK